MVRNKLRVSIINSKSLFFDEILLACGGLTELSDKESAEG